MTRDGAPRTTFLGFRLVIAPIRVHAEVAKEHMTQVRRGRNSRKSEEAGVERGSLLWSGFSRETIKTMGRKETEGRTVERRERGKEGEEKGGGEKEKKGRERGEGRERVHKESTHRIPEADKPQICSWLAGGQLEGDQHPITPRRSRLFVLVRLATDWAVPPTLGWRGGGGCICFTQSTNSHTHLMDISTHISRVLAHLLLL